MGVRDVGGGMHIFAIAEEREGGGGERRREVLSLRDEELQVEGAGIGLGSGG